MQPEHNFEVWMYLAQLQVGLLEEERSAHV